MVCEICGQREATVHVTEIEQGQLREIHMCEECARKQGESMGGPFSWADLLAGLAGVVSEGVVDSSVRCPRCGRGFADFRRTGRLGCSECYATFEDGLVPIIRRVHGATTHTGRRPACVATQAPAACNIEDLRRRLAEAVANEEYEEAARLRDALRELERKQEEGKAKGGAGEEA